MLLNLVKNLRSDEAQTLNRFLKHAPELESTFTQLDSLLLQMIPPRVLIADLKDALRAKADLPIKVWKDKRGKLWVRFHRVEDRAGLFLSFVRQLFGFGLNVQMSSVHTIDGVGVYDWFALRTEKSAQQIAKWLTLPERVNVDLPEVDFQSIDLMAQDEEEWILSFKGATKGGFC